MPLEEGVDDREELSALASGELVDLLKALPEAGVRLSRGGGLEGLCADELVDASAESVRERGENVPRRERSAGLVVSDHALGDAGLLGELALREASGATHGGEAISEAVIGLHGLLSRHGSVHG